MTTGMDNLKIRPRHWHGLGKLQTVDQEEVELEQEAEDSRSLAAAINLKLPQALTTSS